MKKLMTICLLSMLMGISGCGGGNGWFDVPFDDIGAIGISFQEWGEEIKTASLKRKEERRERIEERRIASEEKKAASSKHKEERRIASLRCKWSALSRPMEAMVGKDRVIWSTDIGRTVSSPSLKIGGFSLSIIKPDETKVIHYVADYERIFQVDVYSNVNGGESYSHSFYENGDKRYISSFRKKCLGYMVALVKLREKQEAGYFENAITN